MGCNMLAVDISKVKRGEATESKLPPCKGSPGDMCDSVLWATRCHDMRDVLNIRLTNSAWDEVTVDATRLRLLADTFVALANMLEEENNG